MNDHSRRKHARCTKATSVSYQFMHQSTRHSAVARNYSRFGMYFEARHPLTPGTLIVIRNSGRGADFDSKFASDVPIEDLEMSAACRELKTYVVGEVKRCEAIEESAPPLFGVAVRYVSPAT